MSVPFVSPPDIRLRNPPPVLVWRKLRLYQRLFRKTASFLSLSLQGSYLISIDKCKGTSKPYFGAVVRVVGQNVYLKFNRSILQHSVDYVKDLSLVFVELRPNIKV